VNGVVGEGISNEKGDHCRDETYPNRGDEERIDVGGRQELEIIVKGE
jgi:hypothetical protein